MTCVLQRWDGDCTQQNPPDFRLLTAAALSLSSSGEDQQNANTSLLQQHATDYLSNLNYQQGLLGEDLEPHRRHESVWHGYQWTEFSQ